MADSLFDNRYRYDYIYPRGRSGETLRAVDTLDNDRLVVVKRPAPNDAPPIRAGQEVSILNERKVLTRLTGHPVLTALLGSGQFFVGGMTHQYIVIERGTGEIVANMVSEKAARDERLPELETLIIIELLLDLLQAAHSQDIVYNDVDAKHLFWDRELYSLKVIDWGNAVFLEGDEVTPQGISRQSDVGQVGELLYFILTGGGRPEVPRNAGEDFIVDFRRDGERITSRLQGIVSKALHPNLKLRHRSIADLRRELSDYRLPLERERDAAVARVNERLRRSLSKDDLRSLLTTLEPSLIMDPGNPRARKAREDVLDRLNELEVSADLDAVRIYMESANWERAADLLGELLARSRGEMTSLIKLLTDCALLLSGQSGGAKRVEPTQATQDSISLLFDRDFAQAAQVLLVKADDKTRSLHLLLAERICAYVPDVVLLRPNLYRLEAALKSLAKQAGIAETRALLSEIQDSLDKLANSTAVLMELRDGYRAVVDQLTGLSSLLETFNAQQNLPDDVLPLFALERASIAAMALADNMHVVGKQATSSPRDALQALDNSRAIDPLNPAWDAIERLLDALYELLQSYQTYIPAADGSDLEHWLQESRRDLATFIDRLFDEMLSGMVEGLEIAEHAWGIYAEEAIQGNRLATVTALAEAADAVATISPTLSGWLNQLRTIVTNASYIERHALHGGLGRALADGWEAFDRGRLQDAERLGQQAYEIARSENERFAAKRLRDLSTATYNWTERGGINSTKTSQLVLVSIEELYTPEENNIRQSFAAQMPSKDTYLRAMQKGIVEIYSRSSTAAVRILFANCILLGALDAHDGELEDAAFWREVAVRALGDIGPRHVVARLLDEYLTRRRDVITATKLLNGMHNPQALTSLEATRRQLEDGGQARVLAGAIQSLRELEGVVRDWADGEFRAAGIKLENAINAVNEVEQTAQTTLTVYRSWLMELQSHAAELYTVNRQMRQAIERRPAEPVDVVREAHRRQAEVTAQQLGERNAATLRQWHETYEAFLSVYSDNAVRRTQKLSKFNELFKAMFIDRHPAYPLYRLWYETTERAPEFPAPPTSEPTPKIREDELIDPEEYRAKQVGGGEEESISLRERLASVPRLVWLLISILIVVVAIIVFGILTRVDDDLARLDLTATVVVARNGTSEAELTNSAILAASTTETTNETNEVVVSSVSTSATLPVFDTPTSRAPTVTSLPPLVPTTPAPSITPLPPTNTPTATATYTPSITPTPTNTPTATLPPQGLQGEQNVLALLNTLPADSLPWEADQFSLVTDNDDNQYWRLGRGSLGEGVIVITLPEDFLETYYGNNATTRFYRMEVELTASYNAPLVIDGQVYFGALMQSAADPSSLAGLQVQVVDTNVIDLGQRTSGFENPDEGVTVISRRSVSSMVLSIRLERDPSNGDVVIFVGGNQLGSAMSLVGAQDPIVPAIYVKDGGVIVNITRWTITFR
jgi:serine/threonine protein kinase